VPFELGSLRPRKARISSGNCLVAAFSTASLSFSRAAVDPRAQSRWLCHSKARSLIGRWRVKKLIRALPEDPARLGVQSHFDKHTLKVFVVQCLPSRSRRAVTSWPCLSHISRFITSSDCMLIRGAYGLFRGFSMSPATSLCRLGALSTSLAAIVCMTPHRACSHAATSRAPSARPLRLASRFVALVSCLARRPTCTFPRAPCLARQFHLPVRATSEMSKLPTFQTRRSKTDNRKIQLRWNLCLTRIIFLRPDGETPATLRNSGTRDRPIGWYPRSEFLTMESDI
jgi:hypothetical protein